MNQYSHQIANTFHFRTAQVEAVLQLFTEGATIPFIARYRKDKTGGLDEVQIQQIQEEEKRMAAFSERKQYIINAITGQGKMTDAIMHLIDAAFSINTLEDIYIPYKPKRKTKAQTARENGLEPLALLILQQLPSIDCIAEAKSFINDKITTPEDALLGARDIIAEQISEDADIRASLRNLFQSEANVFAEVTTGKEADGAKYKDYFQFKELVSKIPSHRILAVLRGFLEGVLRLSITPSEESAIEIIEKKILKREYCDSTPYIQKAIKDAWRRLLHPALETECRNELKIKADEEAIEVFSENLKQLLLSAPLGSKNILALDPGYRTGCKLVCIDGNGNLLHNDLIYILDDHKKQQAAAIIQHLVTTYHVEAFAIGNGTAGRETEQFIKSLQLGFPVFMVNEDGASIYSASETARAEFPDFDVTVRGAISIGRRLMDPLAELVKIDPKSIGVGQYQHDVNQSRLKEKLDQAVVSCVNKVGVNLNTSSKHLLSYVSGIGDVLAENIVQYRKQNGTFKSRKELLQVARLGNKAFEQCAGFLRITNALHPLDASAVHPEVYSIAEQMAKDLSVDVKTLIGNELLIQKINPRNYINETVGELTIKDILIELKKPGLDPRTTLEQFEFANIFSIEEVKAGMIVPGIVTNLTRFGAFVDIGVKQDGLVHISEIANKYISDPAEVLKLNDKVIVKVIETDTARKRINLSIKQAVENTQKSKMVHTPKLSTSKSKIESSSLGDALAALKNKFAK